MIKVSHLYKEINGQQILKDINVEIRKGEIVVILGESGSGKSVFLQHLIGLFKPTQGTVEINGEDITRLSEPELLEVRKKIGYLFQEGALYDFMTVFENVAFPLSEHTRLSRQEIKNKVLEMLKTVGLEKAERKLPSELSGGMKKRAALARAVILDSKILFCDEPTSGLDPIRSRDIMDLIKNISHNLNCTTVITSHDIRNALRVADRLVILRQGAVVMAGTPDQLEQSGDPFIKEFLS